jgi:hypothetical protein
MRRQERQLIDDYERAVRAAAALLPDDRDRALAAAKAPQDIRGYEQVKQAGIDSFYQTAGLVSGPSDAALAGARSSTG